MSSKDVVILALQNYAGDDLTRAKMAFKQCTPAQTQEEYYQSGQTRQAVLDAYQRRSDRIKKALDWIRALPDPKD